MDENVTVANNYTASPVSENGTIKATEAPEDPDEYLNDVAKKLTLYIQPVITLGGLMGNVLMFMVMQRKTQRRSPVAVFMSALAITDSLVLILDFLNNWMEIGPGIDLLGSDSAFCDFHRYFFAATYTYASWLVMGLAVERFLVVLFPLRAKDFCTVRGAVITVIFMATTNLVLHLYNLWGFELTPEGQCDVDNDMSDFMSKVSPWLQGVMYSYLPLSVILFANIAIIIRLVHASRTRKAMVGQDKNEDATRRVTTTVVVICVMFFILTTPTTLYYVLLFSAGDFINPGPIHSVVESIIILLALTNHAVNFLLYVWTSVSFRAELHAMFTRKGEIISSTATRSTAVSGTSNQAGESSSSGQGV